MADVLTKEEAEAVAELREYIAGDALIFTKSGPVLALIDHLTAKVRAAEAVIAVIELYGVPVAENELEHYRSVK